MKSYLVTGGAGFIGTNFVKYLLQRYGKDVFILVLDALTYAGRKENLAREIAEQEIVFVEGNICDSALVQSLFQNYDIDYVVNFAAESHVDRSIEQPRLFLETNVLGTHTLLEAAKTAWMIGKDEEGYPVYQEGKKYLQISTDEVYGSLKRDFAEARWKSLQVGTRKQLVRSFGEESFEETRSLQASSPYSSSKAAADLLVLSYAKTYHLPILISRCSNNYGPYQFPEKLLPFFLKRALEGKTLPIYGEGKQVRDWIYVGDHVRALDKILEQGKLGELYHVGGFHEEENLELAQKLLLLLEKVLFEENRKEEKFQEFRKLISKVEMEHVPDRLGHDERYAIDARKLLEDLGWHPEVSFERGLEETVRWYLEKLDFLFASTKA